MLIWGAGLQLGTQIVPKGGCQGGRMPATRPAPVFLRNTLISKRFGETE